MVGNEPIARTEVIKRIWDYIKAQGLQDAKDKRAINADDKLRPVFGKAQVTMFELAGIVGQAPVWPASCCTGACAVSPARRKGRGASAPCAG